MLNDALKKKIHPDLLLFYGKKITHTGILTQIKNEIKTVRTSVKKTGTNQLETKLKKFGNTGGWGKAKSAEIKTKQLERCQGLYLNKNIPTDYQGHWRSIEFELVFKSVVAKDEFALSMVSAGLDKFVTIKTDPTIQVNPGPEFAGGARHEVVLSYRYGNEEAVKIFCRALRGRAYVNKTCGTHVHFDMRNVANETATAYAVRLGRCVPALRLLLPKSRRNSEYCREVINSADGRGQRYAFVNLGAYAKYKTIEVRAHSGTINADKILNWIKVCEKIMATDLTFIPNPAINHGVLNSIDELMKQYDFGAVLNSYIKERYELFNTPAKKKDAAGAPIETEEGEEIPEAVAIPPHMVPMAIPPAPTHAHVPTTMAVGTTAQ